MSVHARIKQYREGRGMTHQQFADAVGVSRGAVQQWERGLTAPTRKNQPTVAAFMGITVSELMDDAPTTLPQLGENFPPNSPNSASNQALAHRGRAGDAINLEAALQIVAQALSSSPSKGSDALAGTLASFSKDPTNPIYAQMLVQLLEPKHPDGSKTIPEPPGFLKR